MESPVLVVRMFAAASAASVSGSISGMQIVVALKMWRDWSVTRKKLA